MARSNNGPKITPAFLKEFDFSAGERGKPLYDPDMPGLRIDPLQSGRWSFMQTYISPVTGKKSRMPILLSLPPAYAAKMLPEIRKTALKYRAEIAAGRDPALDKAEAIVAKRARIERTSVRQALDDYERAFIAGDKASSRRLRMKTLRRAVEPFLDRAAASLTKGDLVLRLDDIQAAIAAAPYSKDGRAIRISSQAEMSAWLSWLSERDVVPANVLMRVRKPRARMRDRVLSDEEIKALVAATVDGSAFCDIVRVLLHTGMRRNEVGQLEAREVDLAQGLIALRKAKTAGSERVVPIPTSLVPMLKARLDGLEPEQYVFGEGSAFNRPYSGWSKSFASLMKAMPPSPPDEHWTLHDLRRTLDTRLNEALVDQRVIDRLVGHVKTGMDAVYNHAKHYGPMRDAVSLYERTIQSIARGGDNVIALRR